MSIDALSQPAPADDMETRRDIRRILREEIRTVQASLPWWQLPALTTERAMEFVGIGNETTFRRRMTEWKVRQCDNGLWPRLKILKAMEATSKQVFSSARGRKARG